MPIGSADLPSIRKEVRNAPKTLSFGAFPQWEGQFAPKTIIFGAFPRGKGQFAPKTISFGAFPQGAGKFPRGEGHSARKGMGNFHEGKAIQRGRGGE